MKTILKASASTAILVAFLATSAHAADVYHQGGSLKDEPTPADYQENVNRSFAGLWVGAFGGYQINTNNLSYSDHFDYKEGRTKSNDWTSETDGLGSQGFTGELGIGYDRMINHSVFVGVFAGVNVDNSEFTERQSSVNTPIDSYANGKDSSFEKEWGGVLGGRVGIVRGNTAFALGGGWAFGEMGMLQKGSFKGDKSESGDAYKDQDTDLNGWFVQGDIEHSLGGGLYAVATARYTDYGALELAGGDYTCGSGTRPVTCPSSAHGSGSTKTELDRDELTAMVGLKYKLGLGN